MIITVASGKGGTGKTTVAVNLAMSLGPGTCLLDCDVEEPNAHLFVRPRWDEQWTVTTPVPSIDPGLCSGCGKCAEICQFKALVVIEKTVLDFPELCHSCGGCVKICPEGAITETGRVLGVIERGQKDGLTLVHGTLRIGEAMSPPLIKEVRSLGPKTGLTIVDAPPGTSCPVIAAMKGADFVLLVTEPTPFGLHDLVLAVGGVRALGIPCGLVINRSDIGDEGVSNYAKEAGIPVLLEIPFDRKIAEIYSRGELLVEVVPSWREVFLALHKAIEKAVGPGGSC